MQRAALPVNPVETVSPFFTSNSSANSVARAFSRHARGIMSQPGGTHQTHQQNSVDSSAASRPWLSSGALMINNRVSRPARLYYTRVRVATRKQTAALHISLPLGRTCEGFAYTRAPEWSMELGCCFACVFFRTGNAMLVDNSWVLRNDARAYWYLWHWKVHDEICVC